MTLGVRGTGPYAIIRRLRQEIADCKYELSLIAQGMRRRLGAKKLKEIIAIKRAEIKEIIEVENAKKIL